MLRVIVASAALETPEGLTIDVPSILCNAV